MTDLTSLGYPQGYHLGISSVLWWISIIVIAILGLGLYLNAKKSDLINVKEVLRTKSFFYIGIGINFSMTQVGMFFPDIFLQLYLFGLFLVTFSATFYLYYWEKNLTTIKRMPTISIGASAIVAFIALTTSIFFPVSPNFLWDFLILTICLLETIGHGLYVYLIYVFSKNVKGVSTKVSTVWMGGVILALIAFFFEYPPGVKVFPEFIVLYIPPIICMIGLGMAFYGINKLLPQISSFYAQTQRCAVHLGTIEKGNPLHYCPSCGIVYCETCFNQVIKKDGCWNCRRGFEPESEEKQLDEPILELKEVDDPKKNLSKKGI